MPDQRVRRVVRSLHQWAPCLAVSFGLASCASLAVSLPVEAAVPSASQDEGLVETLPGVDAMIDLASLAGRWTLTGSEGDGILASQIVEWNEAESMLLVEWSTTDVSGRTLAEGRGRIAWDDIAGAVVNTYAGQDGDRRFSGSATLIGIDGRVSDWRGHETRGSGGSVNFEVTYDLRDDAAFVVDFIPTCLDGLGSLAPVRFAWSRVDPFVEALPNADELVGDWVLVSGGDDHMPDGSTMAVSRGAGGRSLVFVVRHPSKNVDDPLLPGAIVGIEQIWLDEKTGRLFDRYLTMDGEIMTTTPRLDVLGETEATVVMSRWGGDEESASGRQGVTSWMWVVDDELHLALIDFEIDDQLSEPPAEMLWQRR